MIQSMRILPEDVLILMDRTSLHLDLLDHVVTVTFTKKNGVIRLMRCTTNASGIPLASRPQNKSAVIDGVTGLPVQAKEKDLDLFRVWDLDLQAWRTFRYGTLLSVSMNTVENIESLPS